MKSPTLNVTDLEFLIPMNPCLLQTFFEPLSCRKNPTNNNSRKCYNW